MMIDHTPWAALGDRLREARRRAWLSQYDVARQIGITQAAYCQIEQGRIRPRLPHLRQLAALFDLPLIQLLPLADYEPDAFVRSVAMELAAGG
jgi:transcriptional regulator with XRE-family HTH domain